MVTKVPYVVQNGRTNTEIPLNKMAKFVNKSESTHEKSENQPARTLPIVFEIPINENVN